MKCFGELVTMRGLDLAKAIVTNALDADQAYNPKIDPWEIVTNSNKLVGRPRKPKGVAVQQGVHDEQQAEQWGMQGAADLLGGGQ